MFLRFGKLHRQQIGERRLVIAAIGERSPAAQEQQSAAAPIDELLDQLLLRRGEVIRFHAAQDDALESRTDLPPWSGNPSFRFALRIGGTCV